MISFVCSECNNKRICINCGKTHYSGKDYCDTCARGVTLCPNCKTNTFIPASAIDMICFSCQPYCAGCGGKFSPRDKQQRFCNSCAHLRDNYQCTSCATWEVAPDHNGHCDACKGKYAVTDEMYRCSSCNNEVVDHADGLCDKCIGLKDKCPICSAEKSKVDYLCKKCLYGRKAENSV